MIDIRVGNCRELLTRMEDGSVDCCVTSPPYFGLRDYGMPDQIGLEGSPAEFVGAITAVFREVHRVLRDDGTLWLNLGDSYCANGGPGWEGKTGARSDRRFTGTRDTVGMRDASRGAVDKYKPKDLMGLPWRIAFALQADGWYLRQDIIWHKPNPMPESVKDRCTKSHEYLFLLSKSPKYYFDADAIKQPASESSIARLSQPNLAQQKGSARVPGKTNGNMKAVGTDRRNKRSVWTVATRPFSGAHFAAFPPELIVDCVKAGCPAGGVVLDPFGGAGTTGLVASSLGRRAILLELNPEYAEIARARIQDANPLFATVSVS